MSKYGDMIVHGILLLSYLFVITILILGIYISIDSLHLYQKVMSDCDNYPNRLFEYEQRSLLWYKSTVCYIGCYRVNCNISDTIIEDFKRDNNLI